MRRKTLGVARVVRQPVQVFYMQTAAPRTVDAPTLVFQIDPPACQRQVADPAHLLVIAPPAPLPTVRAHSCFFRLCLLFIHPPAHGSEVSPAARNTLDSARIPRASKLLICGLFQKGRVLAQDGSHATGRWSLDTAGQGHPAVPSIYSSARPELDRSPVSRDHVCMISSFVRARPLARPQTQTLSC